MRITAAGAALLAVLAVAACGGGVSTTTIKHASGSGGARVSGSGSGSAQETTTVTHTATAIASGAGGSSPASSGTGGGAPPATPSGGHACVASGLALSFLGQQGATGHGELGFALRNTGTSSCSTVGYPGVQFLGGGGAALPTTPTHTTSDFFGHTTLHALTVGPGQTVSFRLGVTHGEGSSAGCSSASALQVIVPNDTATLRTPIPDGAAECATVTVSPMQAGASAYP